MTPDPAILLGLAERVEAATGPDYVLDADIMNATTATMWNNARPFTASLDAAMMLAVEEDVPELFAEAMSRALRYRAEHNGDIRQLLARFFTAAALRAIAAKEVK